MLNREEYFAVFGEFIRNAGKGAPGPMEPA
jgi:hypothetical protein